MKRLEGLDTIREKVRARDNWTCQSCGKIWQQGQRRFDVHHLELEMENIRSYAYDKANQHKLITLCHKCHLNLPHNKAKQEKQSKRFDKNRADMILKLFHNRYTYQQIGKLFNISRQRVFQIVEKISTSNP